jgi:hypothetical protein
MTHSPARAARALSIRCSLPLGIEARVGYTDRYYE